ncbi:hypothetical protein DI09_217p20 [Mitosporidium daphniae]|uniref:Uncharacterized protein n=1 Tax=Mitosporidium daphniae TaxID=1485682 RepID=A0A098VTC1_9MICR|nr:uncharacterized protein DI09_217p20 [Mitosporidium daphniae]KGG52064.1 hypothetical protein DI09_217p20 [Mitosporidium daphniae]|eukprot:XP_013238500.1 uncharacterized protein DI09_217p20 [Mitosporidium daphniae]
MNRVSPIRPSLLGLGSSHLRVTLQKRLLSSASPKNVVNGMQHDQGATPNGADNTKKLAFVSLSSALTAALVSSDIYIVNSESPLLLTFLIVMRFLYLKAGPVIGEYIENEENRTVKEIQEAFVRRRNALLSRLNHLNAFKEVRGLFEEYLRIKKVCFVAAHTWLGKCASSCGARIFDARDQTSSRGEV